MATAKAAASSGEYLCIEVFLADSETAEILAAEVSEADATGIEERGSSNGIRLLLYAPIVAEEENRAAIGLAVPEAGIGGTDRIARVDWNEQWKSGLKAAERSPRLRVLASFVASATRAAGLSPSGEGGMADAQADVWSALLMTRRVRGASSGACRIA